jgi:plastocyanin
MDRVAIFAVEGQGGIMGNIAYASVIALAALSSAPSKHERTTVLVNDAETVTVQLSNFAFEPAYLRLKAGVPVRLRLINDSNGGHDFSAPAFFAASSFPPGTAAPPNGEVAVGSHKTVDITIVPRVPGAYRLECTHFLHSLFGMHGTIEVIP